MKKFFWCLLFLNDLTLPPAAAQSQALANAWRSQEIGIPYLRNYSPKEYSADVQNWAILQDRRGVMYFGNNWGTLEYDGVSWRPIQTTNRSAVRSLAAGDDGKIYVGARGEIGYLSPDSAGQLRYVSLHDSIAPEYRDFGDIAKTYATSAGIYFQALDRVFLWSNHRMRVWKPPTPFHLSFVVQDRFYIRQPGIGLMQMTGDSLALVPDGEKFAELRIYFMAPFGEDKILIGTREQALFLYDGASAQPFPTAADAFLLESQIYHGAALAGDLFAVATLRAGVAIIDKNGKLQQRLDKTTGLQDDTVWFLAPDDQGGLWLALNNGIARVETPSPLSLFNENTGLRGDVASILRHREVLYAATGQGVYYLQPHPEHAPDQQTVFKPVAGIASQSLSLLSTGNALLAATSDGVYQIDRAQAELIQELPSRVLYRSHIDTTRIYVGLENGLAILRLLPPANNGGRSDAKPKWIVEGNINGITGEVRSILETKEKMLWLGTRSQGFIRVDFSTGFRLDPPIKNFDFDSGLPKARGWVDVYSLFDYELFNTEKGIFKFSEREQRFIPDSTFGISFAMGSQVISALAMDHAGKVWMEADNKSSVVKRAPDGALLWEKTPLSRMADFKVWTIYPENDGITWFGGPDGLTRYDTAVPKDYAAKFAALIRRVGTVDHDSLIFGGSETGAALPPILRYADNALRFEFAAPSFDDESANRFQYFLEGFDKGWSEWTKENKKDYTNLPDGEFKFHLRARNIYEHGSAEAVYRVRVLPPWYRTWWAYLFYLGALALSIYGFIKYRTRQLEQKSRDLEQVVQQRTEEIRQQAEELETLDEIVKVINQEVALESVLKSLLQEGLKLFPQAEKASVLLFDPQAACFKFAVAVGYDWSLLNNIAFTPEQMANRYIQRSEEVGTGVYIVRELKNLYDEEILNVSSIPQSVLAMTAVWEGKLEAFLVFDNFSNAEAFDHSDAHKLNRFRSHAISAIAKAKMLQELQEKNAEIIRTQEQLIMQEKLASLGGLTAGIAHEIKNPLNFVNNFAELSVGLAQELREEIEKLNTKVEAPVADSIAEILRDLEQNAKKINEHGKRADGIVRGMLMHSRGHTGEREAIDINAMLDEDLNLAYHGLRANDISFNIKIEKAYDNTIGQVAVLPQELSRVFLNIINNACYATRQKQKALDGSFIPTLTVRTQNLGDKIEIRIRDNGTGIPAAVRDKIFNPFFTTKPTGQGTGLGLSISYEIIVQKHKGGIRIETEEGQFTEFIINLPKSAEGLGQKP